MADAPEPATVVVGVKDTARSRGAIMLAAREAAYRGAALLAVTAYRTDPALGAPAGRPLAVQPSAGEERLIAESALRDAIVDALGEQAGQVAVRAAPGLGGRVLVDTARKFNADLIVLASRSSPASVPGTVSQYVLRRAPCPVLVVPAASDTGQQGPAGGLTPAPREEGDGEKAQPA